MNSEEIYYLFIEHAALIVMRKFLGRYVTSEDINRFKFTFDQDKINVKYRLYKAGIVKIYLQDNEIMFIFEVDEFWKVWDN